jgi:hypothetical protein
MIDTHHKPFYCTSKSCCYYVLNKKCFYDLLSKTSVLYSFFFLFSISFFWSWYVSVNLSLNQLWFHLFKKNVNVAKHTRTITFWNFDNIYLFHSKANHFDHCYNCVSFYVGSFVVKNKPADGKRFIRLLGKVSTLSFLPLLLVIPCIYWEHSPKNKVLSLWICKENYYYTQSFKCVFS